MTPLLNHLHSSVSWFPPLEKVSSAVLLCMHACAYSCFRGIPIILASQAFLLQRAGLMMCHAYIRPLHPALWQVAV